MHVLELENLVLGDQCSSIKCVTVLNVRKVTEIVAGITRWKRYLDFLIKAYYDADGYDRMEPLLRQILRLGVFELVKMETAPHAAIYETVKLGKCSLRLRAGNLINGLLRSIVRHKVCRSQARALADLYSHPVWMVRRWMSRFGKHETILLMEWNNKPPIYGLRANSVRAYSREALLANLTDMDVAHEPSSVLEDFVRVSGGLLALRIRQLERRKVDIEQAKEKLKVARLKNKAAFDNKHRLRPYVIKDGDCVLVYDSNLENQYTTMRKMVKRWFGPYVVLHAYDNATYKLCELDGTQLKVPIAGKRIELYKKREGEFVLEDLSLDQLPRNEVYASDDESDDALDEED
ncbi:hypothetical protein L7F22_041945 [Adiantum nelumboides]|nr:hypothetical protein [Adiantum nelumboides]